MARIILRDGRVADLRQAENCEADHQLVSTLFANASPDSLYFRFFRAVKEVSPDVVDGMLGGNGSDHLSLLCLSGNRALGIGSYMRVDDDTAEVAFLVDDELHGKGLGSLLLEHLAEAAWIRGFKRFEANVLGGNHKMLQVFRASGYELEQTYQTGALQLVLPLTQTERSRSLQETREKLATAASLLPFFAPASVAVVGASRDKQGLGHIVFRNILNGGFQGTVYPVNTSAQTVASVRAYSTLVELPERIDLAVVVVPASEVLDVVDQCVRAHVRGVMILTAGFAERDTAGAKLQQQVLERLRNSGCRLIGPNCLGLMTTASDVQLNASFAPHMPKQPGMSIASQSGALGIAILEYAIRTGVGVSHFVSVGNKADVSSNDLVQFWEDDPNTTQIALYLESFGNPRKFSRMARRITRKKPMLVVKGAKTPTTQTISDTGSTIPTISSEAVVDALFQQTGMIRLDTLQEMFDVAALLAGSPLPQGKRVAIVTNSTGGAVITADAVLKEGLTFVQPVIDLGFDALAKGYREVLPQVLRDEAVDAVIVLFVPVGVSDEQGVISAISDACDEAASEGVAEKPVVANFLTTGDYLVRHIQTRYRQIPIYPFPEQAVRALAKVSGYANYLRTAQGQVPDLAGADPEQARAVARSSAANASPVLSEATANALLNAMGVNWQYGAVVTDEGALDIRVNISSDPLFGPVLRVERLLGGAGTNSVPVEVVVRITPLTNLDAEQVVTVLSEQFDGQHGCQQILVDLLLRLSRLVEEVPEIDAILLPHVRVQKSVYFLSKPAIKLVEERAG